MVTSNDISQLDVSEALKTRALSFLESLPQEELSVYELDGDLQFEFFNGESFCVLLMYESGETILTCGGNKELEIDSIGSPAELKMKLNGE